MRNIILLVIGQKVDGKLICETLGKSFVTEEIQSATEAINYIDANNKKICGIVLDSGISDAGYVSVIKYLEATSLVGSFPILLLTHFNEIDDLSCYDEIDDVSIKPVNPSVFKKRMRNLVELYNYRRNAKKEEMINN